MQCTHSVEAGERGRQLDAHLPGHGHEQRHGVLRQQPHAVRLTGAAQLPHEPLQPLRAQRASRGPACPAPQRRRRQLRAQPRGGPLSRFKTQRALSITQEALSITQEALSIAQEALSITQEALSITQEALSITQEALSVTQRALSIAQEALSITQRALSVTQEAHLEQRRQPRVRLGVVLEREHLRTLPHLPQIIESLSVSQLPIIINVWLRP
jgi:hypothetical protein